MKQTEMTNASILQKILNWIKGNTFWTIIGGIGAILGIYWGFSDRIKKPELEISIKGHSMSKGPKCDIFYLIPQEYLDSGTKGALVFELSNQGKAELENVYAMFETSSVYQSEQQMTLSSGVAQAVENSTLRFRRFVGRDTVDYVTGEKMTVSYSGDSETLSCVFRTIQHGLAKQVQPVFTIDQEYSKQLETIAQTRNLGQPLGAKVYDCFSMDLSYAATGINAETVDGIKVFVAQNIPIEGLLSNYEKEGALFSAVVFDKDNIKRRRGNCILVYPRMYLEDGIVNVDVDGGQYYYVEYDIVDKEARKHSIRVENLNTGQVETYRFK